MKFRLPASISLFAVPVLCLALIGLAWFFARGGGESADAPVATLRLLADESLQPSLAGLVAAFQRRAGVAAEVSYRSGAELTEGFPLPRSEMFPEEVAHDLLLLPEASPVPAALAGVPAAEPVGGVRVLSLPNGTAPDDASLFLDFLEGSFAREILLQQGAGRPLVPPPAQP